MQLGQGVGVALRGEVDMLDAGEQVAERGRDHRRLGQHRQQALVLFVGHGQLAFDVGRHHRRRRHDHHDEVGAGDALTDGAPPCRAAGDVVAVEPDLVAGALEVLP